MNEKAKRPVTIDSMRRASISADGATYPLLIGRAERLAKALLPNVTSEIEADERSRWVVLELLNDVTERSGRADANERVITRDEVLRLLSTPQDRIPTKAWDDELEGDLLRISSCSGRRATGCTRDVQA